MLFLNKQNQDFTMRTFLTSLFISVLFIFSCKNPHKPAQAPPWDTSILPISNSETTGLDTIADTDKIKQFFEIANTNNRSKALQFIDTSLVDKRKIKDFFNKVSGIKQITTIYRVLTYKTYFKLYFVQAITKQNEEKNFLVKIDGLNGTIEDLKVIPNKIRPDLAVNIIFKQVFSGHLDSIPTVLQDRGQYQVQSIGSSQWPLIDSLELIDQFYTRFGQDSFITYKFSFLDLYQDWQNRDLERWFWIFYYELNKDNLLMLKNLDIFHSEGEQNVPLLFDIIPAGNYDFLYGEQSFVEHYREVRHQIFKYYLHPGGKAALWLRDLIYTNNGDTTNALITNSSFYLSNGTPMAKVRLTAIDHGKRRTAILRFKYDFKTNSFIAIDSLSARNLNNLQNVDNTVLDIID